MHKDRCTLPCKGILGQRGHAETAPWRVSILCDKGSLLWDSPESRAWALGCRAEEEFEPGSGAAEQ